LAHGAEPDVEHGRPSSPFRGESKERANDLALLFRQSGKETFIQAPLSNETGKDERKLRVSIIECLVDLPPSLTEIVFDLPHLGRRRCGVSHSLEFGHYLGERR